jgi:hypothetical protein
VCSQVRLGGCGGGAAALPPTTPCDSTQGRKRQTVLISLAIACHQYFGDFDFAQAAFASVAGVRQHGTSISRGD